MTKKILQKKYAELMQEANLAEGRKETISYLHKAEKIRNKITKKFTVYKSRTIIVNQLR